MVNRLLIFIVQSFYHLQNLGTSFNFMHSSFTRIAVPKKLIIILSVISNKVRVMVFNATFSNISAISCRSGLLVEETGGPGENHRPAASH